MSRIRGKGTKPERTVEGFLFSAGLRFDSHANDLPGCPDFALREFRVAIFVDGDFWHGWRFECWRLKLSEAWEEKIEANRIRDRRNHARLRRMGWIVLRLWEHQVDRATERCIHRIKLAVERGGHGESRMGVANKPQRRKGWTA
jgi:DNA mismatch endonuclease (patch repair protein)